MIPREKNKNQDCCLVKIYEHLADYNDEGILIKEDDRCITCFYVKNYDEFMKFIWFCKENGVSVYFNENDEYIDRYMNKYDNPIFGETIYDIWITLPTEESVLCINISI